MTRLTLGGLVGSKPIGAMAAFGLMNFCHGIPAYKGAKLGWSLQDDWVPFLDIPFKVNPVSFIEKLVEEHGKQTYPWLYWEGKENDIRVSPERFREQACHSLSEASAQDRQAVDFMAAFGSDVFLDGNGNVAPTHLHMTSANQKFLKLLQALDKSLKTSGKTDLESAFRQAVFGPWLYQDTEHSLGWDPDMERMHALRFRNPSPDKANRSVRAGVWLAALSMSLFPTCPGTRRIQTAGFHRRNRDYCFRWPLWETPVSLWVLKSLLTHPDIHSGTRENLRLKRIKICAIFESKKHTFGQGYGIFRPAELVF